MVERCALSDSDLKIKFRTILLTSITLGVSYRLYSIQDVFELLGDLAQCLRTKI